MQLHLLRFLREDFARVGQAKLPQFILKRSKKVKTSIYIYGLFCFGFASGDEYAG